MSKTINAGKVTFVPKGTFSNNIDYKKFDIVIYNGSSYFAKKDTIGHTPTEDEFWQLVAEKGQNGAPGAVKMQVVDTLPETGETDTIYLLKKEKPGVQNLYDEYVYTNTGWEHIGDTSVDLSDYYTKEESDKKFTYIAGDNITISDDNKISVTNNGLMIFKCNIKSGENYTDTANLSAASELINNLYTTGQYSFVLDAPSVSGVSTIFVLKTGLKNTSTIYFNGIINSTNNGYNTIIQGAQLNIYGSWLGDTFTANRILLIRSSDDFGMATIQSKFLSKTNTTSYTPTADYHPSTKKYVDDSITKLDNTLFINNINMSNTVVNLNSYNDDLTTIINNNLDKSFNIVLKNDHEILTATSSFRTPSTTASGYTRFIGIYTTPDNSSSFYTKSFRTFQIDYNLDATSKKVTVTGFSLIAQEYIATTQSVLFRDNISVYTPTSNYNPATKLYTDRTHYENMTGYDATKTQVLKNVNGTLTWVDET